MAMWSRWRRCTAVLSMAVILAGLSQVIAPGVVASEAGPEAPALHRVWAGERVSLRVGESAILTVGGALRVAVAEPKVADVAVISRDEVLITARDPGETSLHVWDENGLRSFTIRVGENNTELEQQIKERIGLPGVDTWVHAGTVVLEGWVESTAERQRAVQVAQTFGKVVDLLTLRLPEPKGEAAAEAGDRSEEELEAETARLIAELRALIDDPHLMLYAVNGVLLLDGSLADGQAQERARKLASLYFTQVIDVTRVRAPAVVERPDLALQVARAIDRSGLVVRTAGEKLLLEGALRDQNELARALHIAGGYAKDVVSLVALTHPLQVALQVQVVEVDSSKAGELGVTWGSLNRGVLEPNTFFAGEVDMNWHIQRLAFIGAKIQTMVDNGHARVLAAPTLVAMSGEPAHFLAGGEIPVAMPQGDKYVIEWKEYGVRLQLQAVVDSGGYITVTLTPEVSTLDWANGVRVAAVVMPALRTRRAHTQVRVENGATLVIGGLLSREDSKQVGKIPLLADLPVLGRLFRSEKFSQGQTELLFFVTPRILGRDGGVTPEMMLEAPEAEEWYERFGEVTGPAGHGARP